MGLGLCNRLHNNTSQHGTAAVTFVSVFCSAFLQCLDYHMQTYSETRANTHSETRAHKHSETRAHTHIRGLIFVLGKGTAFVIVKLKFCHMDMLAWLKYTLANV